MKKSNRIYEPHLTIKEVSIPPKGEWVPRLNGWSFIQVKHGAGYYLKPQFNQELETGTMLLVGSGGQGSIRASQLCGLSLHFFNVIPDRMAGLITLNEQRFFEMAAGRKELSLQVFSPGSRVAAKMEELVASQNRGGLLFRLKLFQLLAEVFEDDLGQIVTDTETPDAGKRLEGFLRQTPSSELLEMDFNELAQITNCTSRHLSRIFYKLVGMSFSDKRSELRLSRALELLATSDSKVVDVGLESGFKSLSQFNQMFVQRFGISPGRWRQKHRNGGVPVVQNRPKALFVDGFHAVPAGRL